MITLAFGAPALTTLSSELRHDSLESAAIVLAVPMSLGDGGWRLLVREVHVAPDSAYAERTPIAVHLKSEFCLPLEARARQHGWSLVYVHTHPGAAEARFSPIDDRSEASMAAYLAARYAGRPHLSLLLAGDHASARVLGTRDGVRVLEVGSKIVVAFDPREPLRLDHRFDRQVRAFGPDGQARLRRMVVAITGLGGTGSLVTEQLAHLGVGSFILVDDDTVENTNLNRVVGAEPADVGVMKKVDVAARLIRRINPDAQIVAIDGNVTDAGIARRAAEADLMFNCTDTDASRHLLNQASYQFLTPLIDMGVGISVDADMNARFAGHVKMMAPDLGCLWCANKLDPNRVRIELMTEAQRQGDPYFEGAAAVTQPAVISLNGVVSSVAVTMLLSAVAGVPSDPRYVHYDGNRARMNAVSVRRDAACNFCGPDSTAGWGDTYDLPVRRRG